jgi:hypothetical protein
MTSRGKSAIQTSTERGEGRYRVRPWFGSLMGFEAATLVIASILHFGVIKSATERNAAIPELIIAIVLAVGATAVFRAPARAWGIAIGTSCFATVGVLYGLSVTASGHGPDKTANVTYHVFILTVLVIGLVLMIVSGARARGDKT